MPSWRYANRRRYCRRSPDNVFVTEFVNEERYMVVSNMTDQPYTLRLKDRWYDRVGEGTSDTFSIPSKRILFLKKPHMQL